MGAVDKTDMILNSINTVRKSLKWYKKFFFHCWTFPFTMLTLQNYVQKEYNICEISFMSHSRNST